MTEPVTIEEAMTLLRDIRMHRGGPFRRGSVYISRGYADADEEIGNRIRTILNRFDGTSDQIGGDR
jgi:hypothetical protein|tara:strand:+ start:276 stop:473 length:198 start_codon:yes stop_codon:yes gene_type:complete